MTNILQKYVSKQFKKNKRQLAASVLQREESSLDFNMVSNNQFKPIPLYLEDRKDRMMRIKENTNLKFLDNINNKGVINGRRLGEGGCLLFSKINPQTHLHPSMTPNSVQYTIGDLGKRLPAKLRGKYNLEMQGIDSIKYLVAKKLSGSEELEEINQVKKLTDETFQSI